MTHTWRSFPARATTAALTLATLCISAAAAPDAEWTQLCKDVESRQAELRALIAQAEAKGINTDYASVSDHVISTFRVAAQNDRDNVEEVRRIFSGFWRLRESASAEADRLAGNELRACIEVADHSITEIAQQLDGTIELSDPPNFSRGKLRLGPGHYLLDGRPVFPSSLVWINDDEAFLQAFGRIGQGYYSLTNLSEDGTVGSRSLNRYIDRATAKVAQNTAPHVFFIGHSPARWMTERQPEILHGARNFTGYDIDNPLVRHSFKKLCAQMLPEWSRSCGNLPRMHLLANEPHFATAKHGWLAKNGVSDHTIRKYHVWLAAKYKTIDALNSVYGTAHANFEQVTFYQEGTGEVEEEESYRERQIDPKLRGGPVWYDWCRFNMDRVNDWFAFLKTQVQANDGVKAPVTIKMLGGTLSGNSRDGGMDIETLTRLQDVAGADLRAIPRDATIFGKHEEGTDPETGWKAHYAYDWIEQTMYLDFTKSLCPEKVFYDSEWHGLSAVSWRHLKLDRDYVRSALWLAFSHGMGMIKPWLWGRTDEHALTDKATHIGELTTQPIALDAYGRTLKKLNAHATWLAPGLPADRRFMIYYCEECAIQDESYTRGFKDIYEALKLLNLPVGFTTPSEIGSLDPANQTVIVSPTPFIADRSLAAIRGFRKSDGRVVLVGASESFLKNELGQTRTGEAMPSPHASLPMAGPMEMIAALEETLSPLAPEPPMKVSVTDETGNPARGVIINRIRHAKTGQLILLMNNVSKDRRVTLLHPEEGTTGFTDIITRQKMPARLVMDPCSVRAILHGNLKK